MNLRFFNFCDQISVTIYTTVDTLHSQITHTLGIIRNYIFRLFSEMLINYIQKQYPLSSLWESLILYQSYPDERTFTILTILKILQGGPTCLPGISQMRFRILDIIHCWAELIHAPLRWRSIVKALMWSYLVSNSS